ncbi:unnamed protein product [Diatraea saccharalis]|uniref:Uncharacterized protein n=1 Tax=Diatraea saccharalis TaxID=40085 RepID=A0A9P0G0R5_9NEOP|nr:unnamed protein product [Diatraea saccharalis]
MFVEPVMAKNDNDLESDFSNEQASADTGRGSSLAFSDTDKCFHSPDYFMDHSPTDTEDITEKIQINHIVTSPNLSDQKIDMATNPTPAKQSIFSPTKTKVPFEVNEVNACTELGYDSQTKIILPIEQQQNYKEKQFDVNKIVHKDAITKVSDETLACHNESSEKECLEMNNSNKFNENNRRDGEIEMILSKMRLSHSLITPIPTTPLKSGYSLSDPVNKESNLCMPDHNFVCKDALKVKEENLSLRANLVKLANEIESIKDILKNKNLLTQQHLMTYNTEIEFDVNDDNIRKLPAEVNQNNSESLHLEMMNNSISGDDSPVFDECDIVKSTRKSLKRLKFEEPLLSLQNGSPRLLPESIQEKDDQKEVISDVRNIDDNANNSIRKAYKQRKLTKLERLRQKLVPKNKIKANIAPIGKLRKKHKHRIINGVTDKVAISLKNKKAYEKAVKIMVELKSQQKTGIAQKTNSFENKGKQTFKKKNSIPINKSQFKMSSISEISTSNKNLTNQIDQNTKDQQNSKKIIILENILLTNSQNCNEKKISSQDSLHTCLTDVSAAKNTNKVTFNEKEDCLVTTPKLKVLQEENINVSNISADRNDFINDKEKEKKNNVIEDKQQMQTQYLPIDSNTKISVSPCAEKIQNTEDENKVTNDLSEASNVHTKNMTSETEKNDITTPLVKQHELPKNLITTRSRTKIADSSSSCQIKHYNIVDDQLKLADEIIQALNNNVDIKNDIQQRARKRQNRMSDDRSDIECKRRLRSSTVRAPSTEENIKIPENIKNVAVSAVADSNVKLDTACVNLSQEEPKTKEAHRQIRDNIVSYDDLDLFSPNIKQIHSSQNSATEKEVMHPKNSILCMMLDKYGKRSAKNFSKKISDTVINTISQTIENEISTIIDAPSKDSKELMNGFVDKIKKWNNKQFMAGLMQYLKDPQRKIELYGKTCTPPAPPMTKSEQILLYVVAQLKNIWTTINVVDCLLHNMEYVLFKLNRTPGFDTIESMSHFYAITCRYFKMKSRLRLFMLDAMYCIQFKSVPLIKQCMEVWMHVLPLAHMGIAKSTLVTCMVYLLHFYKCDDKYNRVQDIRYLLNRKYFYEITEWNEPKIIEMFRNAIRDVKVIPMEIKLLRIALIIIAKRHGPKWCQKNIIRNLLIPMIESDDYPERVKIFCVSMLGPLLKTYPIDMRVHFEIVMNMLLDMLKRNRKY